MTSISIACAHCGANLSRPGTVPGHRLAVTCLPRPVDPGLRLAVHVEPPIDGTLDFCGRECLRNYLNADAKKEAA